MIYLIEISNIFAAKKNKSRDEVVEPRPGMLSLQEFKSVISGMLGSNKFDEQMEKLFYKVKLFV